MIYDLFISYSRADFDEVSALIKWLQCQIPGLKCWFDITGIESASEFEDKIISAISESSYVLFALSDNSMNSSWTKDEVTYAKNIGKKVIPVLLKGASLKEGWFLFKFGRVDCIDSTNELQLQKLVNDLSKWTHVNYRINKEATLKAHALNSNALKSLQSGEYKEAVEFLTIAAKMEYPDSLYLLGYCYQHGLGVQTDIKKSVYLYRRSADFGHREAIYMIGYISEQGLLGKVNLQYAITWYRRAVDLGCKYAMYALAQCYELGKGVRINVPMAIELYTSAADLGHVHASKRLENLIEQ